MILGILSDTHDQLGRTRAAVELLRAAGAEALIHCGDVTGPAVVEICSALPCHYVLGNNDADSVPELTAAAAAFGGVLLGWAGEVALAGRRVAVTHGHMGTHVRRLLAAGPDYLLTGHSHIPADFRDEATRRINPGALHRAVEYTAAALDLASDQVRFILVPR